MNGKYIFISCLIFSFLSCKSNKDILKSYDGDKIVIGFGGGFAGTVTEYMIYETGESFKKAPGTNEFNFISKLEKKQAKQLFNNYELLNISNLSLNDPGNMYSFLRFDSKKKSYKQTWGGKNTEVPNALTQYYNHIKYLVNTLENPVR